MWKLLIVAAVASTATANNFTRIMEHDCDGNFYLFPNIPDLTMAAGGDGRFNSVFSAVRNYVISTVECHCPSLKNSGKVDLYFGLGLELALRIVQRGGGWSRSELDTICNGLEKFDNVGDDDYLPVDLQDEIDPYWSVPPMTCTYDKYMTDGCFFKWDVANVTIQAAAMQCPTNGDNKLPFLSFSVVGDLPEHFMKPCKTTSDCGGISCDIPIKLFDDESTDSIGEVLVDGMEELKMYDENSCKSSQSAFGNDITKVIFGFVGEMMGAKEDTSDYSKVCGLTTLSDSFDDQETVVTTENYLHQVGDYCDKTKDCAGGLLCYQCYRSPDTGFNNQQICNQTKFQYNWYFGVCTPCSYCSNSTPGGGLRDVDKNCYCNRTITTVPNAFKAWSGLMPNGMNIRDLRNGKHPLAGALNFDKRIVSKCKDSYNAGKVVPVMQHQCRFDSQDLLGGGSALTPLSPMRAIMTWPLFSKVFDKMVIPILKKVIDNCQNNQLSLLKDYLPWHAGFWVRMMNMGQWLSTSTTTSQAPTVTDVMTFFQFLKDEIDFDNTISLPTTCSNDRWEKEGICQIQYSKLAEIFNFTQGSLTIRITMSKCNDNPDSIPFVYMDCVGSNCKTIFEFYNIQLCSSNSDCGTGINCSSFDNYKIDFDSDNQQYNGSALLPYALWEATNTDTCGNYTTDMFELVNLARNWAGKTPLTSAQKNGATGICQTVFELGVEDSDLERWSDDLVTETTNMYGTTHYTVHGLEGFTGDDGCKDGIDGGAGLYKNQATSSIASTTTSGMPTTSTLVLTFSGANLDDFSEAEKVAFTNALLNAIKTLGTQSNVDVSQITSDKVTLKKNNNGGVSAEIDLGQNATSATALDTALEQPTNQQALISTIENTPGALPAGSSSLTVDAGVVTTIQTTVAPGTTNDSNSTIIIIAAVCSVVVIITIIVGVTLCVVLKGGSSSNAPAPIYNSDVPDVQDTNMNPAYEVAT